MFRHRIATRIRELKVRACDVGDRRLRYGVTVPPAPPDHLQTGGVDSSTTADDMPAPQPGGGEREEDEEEDLRRCALLYGAEAVRLADIVDKGVNTVLQWLSEDPTTPMESPDWDALCKVRELQISSPPIHSERTRLIATVNR